MNEIEQFYAERAEAIQRDLLGRYALAWADERVQELARKLVGLDLLTAVGVAQKLTAGKKQKGKRP